MHIQIVTFNLRGISEKDYRALCEQLAPTFAAMPGLLSKVWLADSTTNTYGGIYTWENKAAMERYLQEEMFNGKDNHAVLTNIASRDFDIFAEPTQVTHKLALVTA